MLRAPDFPNNLTWLNTDKKLSIKQLKGHIILLDFWTYCCINCLHVLPDLAWLEHKYKDEPFVVIGVHSGKFDTEKDEKQIDLAIERYEIEHPVVIDSDYDVWQAYTVRAWPSYVLIGPDGRIITMLSGEGKREVLDKAIQAALEKGKREGNLTQTRETINIPIREKQHFFSFPGKLAFDAIKQHLFVADSNNHRIVELELEDGSSARVVSIIGSGEIGESDGPVNKASFYRPQGIYYENDMLYVCDTENNLLRQVDLTNESVTTIAGTSTRLNSPWDIVKVGDSLFVAMAGSHQLWRLDLTTGLITPFAGNGWENIVDGPASEALLAQPSGITYGGDALYFADSEVSALRTCTLPEGNVSTLIGTGLFDFGMRDGDFARARLQHPMGVYCEDGVIYIADAYNHAIRAADLRKNELQTVICNTLNEPNDVLKVGNTLYIADTNNHSIKVYDLIAKEIKTLYIH